ncbi:hypothetical protein [Sulfitobacter pontiacus]|uniref:hypothetical protein n=1 Tax=Sulfitobacter pontiacus TaxID=60137 RepID=UPI0030ED862E
MQSAQEHQTQADFARHMGVSRAAVSQWKSRDILQDDAFTQPGKKGKVVVSVAVEQVRRNRDIGQALGNGIETRTSTDTAPTADLPDEIPTEEAQPELPTASAAPVQTEPTAAAPAAAKKDTVEDQLKRAKLEQQLRTNRIQASEEALRQGMLVAADDAREQMTRVASMMLQIFEGSLPELSKTIAAQFDVSQRDVLHLLRAEFKKVRASASDKERARTAAVASEKNAEIELG